MADRRRNGHHRARRHAAQFRDAGIVAPTLHAGTDEARVTLAELADAGIDLDAVTRELDNEGAQRFADAYDEMLGAISGKRQRARAGRRRRG